MAKLIMERVSLGTGELNWLRGERIFDRYGYINLWTDMNDETTHDLPEAWKLIERKGTLIAIVQETRVSIHIGDMFHAVGPVTPEVGEEIVLGTGELDIYTDGDGWTCVGLKPDDGREYFWLDVPMLYRAHSQIVELFFEQEIES